MSYIFMSYINHGNNKVTNFIFFKLNFQAYEKQLIKVEVLKLLGNILVVVIKNDF